MTPDFPYLALRAYLHSRSGVQAAYALSLSELPALWECSEKTAKRQLKRLQEAGLLTLKPGRGRGNLSQLAFTRDLQQEVAALVRDLCAAGDAAALARLSRLPLPRHWVLTDAVRGLFGLSESAGGVDRLRTVFTRDLMPLDPLVVSATSEAHLLAQVLDPLLRFDTDAGELQPHLAHHWHVSEDGLNWTFHLRKAVQFHHGRTLDAADVVYTLGRVRRGAAWFLPHLVKVQASSPFAVRLTLSQPDAFLPRRLTDTVALILPRDIPLDPFSPVGTGAFRWQAFDGGARLTAFDAHFAGRPLIDEVEFYRVDALTSRFDWQVIGEETEAVQSWHAENGVQFMLWNAHRRAAGHEALRLAVCELHDIRAFWAETSQAAPLLPASSFYPRRSVLTPPRERSEARAAALLAQAGYAGPPLQLWVLNRPSAIQEAQWLQARVARHGLAIEVHLFELDYVPTASDPADLVMLGEVAGPDEHLAFWTAMNQPELLFRVMLPPAVLEQIDALLDVYRLQDDFQAREDAIAAAERLLQEGGHLSLTFHRVKPRHLHPLIRDVLPDAYGRFNLKKLWVGERRGPE